MAYDAYIVNTDNVNANQHIMLLKFLFYFFFRYDFDKDGFIKKEDVRLVLSHIPIERTIMSHIQGEGRFTSEGGGK